LKLNLFIMKELLKYTSLIVLSLFIMTSCVDKKKEASKFIESGKIRTDNSDFEGAIKDFTKAIEFTPENAKIWYYRGNIYVSMQKITEALSNYNKAIELDEKFTDAYFNRGYAYFILNEKDKSCADYLMAAKLGKDNVGDRLRNCR